MDSAALSQELSTINSSYADHDKDVSMTNSSSPASSIPAAIECGQSALDQLVSVIIVSSPSPSHPAMDLVQRVVQSLQHIGGFRRPRIAIVLDGYVLGSSDRTKKGKITSELAEKYELYCEQLIGFANDAEANIFQLTNRDVFNPWFDIIRLSAHRGFALGVREGLERCSTAFALILQQDRAFHRTISDLEKVIATFEQPGNEHIRYVGFPTSASRTHASLLKKQYYLDCLLSESARVYIDDSLDNFNSCNSSSAQSGRYLQPLIFWYDSNHLCHVNRYLQIYFPYRNSPAIMKQRLGTRAIRDMILRNGDFIEDKFGQFQRNYLISLARNRDIYSDDDILSAFKWFGSYLYWEEDKQQRISSILPRHDQSVWNEVHAAIEAAIDEEADDRSIESEGIEYEELASSMLESSATEVDVVNAVTFVVHLRGRVYNPQFALERRQLGLIKHYGSVGCSNGGTNSLTG